MQNHLKKIVPILLLGSSVWAQSPFALHLYATGMSMEYKEYNDVDVILDSEESGFTDITGLDGGVDYTVSHNNDFYSNLEFDYLRVTGTTDYKGALLGSGEGYGSFISTTQDKLEDTRFMFNELYALSSSVKIKGGIGYGHHSWRRELSAAQVETYEWDYLRLMAGGILKFDSSSNFTLDISAAYENALSPTMRAEMQVVNLEFDLGGVECYEADIYGMFDVGYGFSVVGGYIYKKQNIAKSNKVPLGQGYAYEPKSVDYQQFFKLGIKYSF